MTEKPRDDWDAREWFEHAATGAIPTIDSPSTPDEESEQTVSNTVSIVELKQHPLYTFLRDVQAGHVPARGEIEDFNLPMASRKRLERAVEELKSLRAAGEHGESERAYARDAEEIVAALPRHQRDPHYNDPPDDAPTDPVSLAAGVQRW